MSTSLFDDDLYKFTMQQAVLELYPDAVAQYRFKNRGEQKFNREFITRLNLAIKGMGDIKAPNDQLEQFSKLRFVKPWYVEYLKNYRYEPDQVRATLDNYDDLNIIIDGPWHSTILWEVKLMALVSELYFSTIDLDWDLTDQKERIYSKGNQLTLGVANYADFGTRRRRSRKTQEIIVDSLFEYNGRFLGTSNVEMALKHNSNPIGTMAHEWAQGISVLESLNHANKYMLKQWAKVYLADLGIALTDTYMDHAFFQDFDMHMAKVYDGVRHDSGNPFEFTKRVVCHYKSLGINPEYKSIVFSNGLDVTEALSIADYCNKLKINCAFGIGTHFTNDFINTKTGKKSPSLNMVIKLWRMNGCPVVKLSNNPGKASGELNAVERMKAIYS